MNRQQNATPSLRLKVSNQKPSRALDEFVRSIGDCKSKIDEDRIMVREEQNLRQAFNSTSGLKGRELEEALLRAMYLNILNYDSDFALIPALNGLATKDLKTKRLCYLATSLFIQPDSSELLLLVNSIQKDLIDDNYLVKWTALSALTTMISLELVPAILPQVSKCLSHPRELIRKKAVLALQRFIQLDNAAVLGGEGAISAVEGTGVGQMLRTALCDKDPSVMGASLNAFMEVVKVDPEAYRNLVPSFVSILKQVIERRLPRTYEYKKHPAPWMQIRLLKLISCLCAGDRGASENAYAILAETMKAANTGTPIGTAIMYECILTIANIFPSTGLLSQVETLLDPWVRSHSINLKHAFLHAQIHLSKVNTDFSKKYQRQVVEFMEYPDSTLRWMAFLLLCEITRTHNVTAILPHLTSFCEQITDERMRLDLAHRIYELAEKYAPDFQFFVEAALEVFRVLGEGSEDLREQDLVFRFVSSFQDQPQDQIPQALALCIDALLDQGIRATAALATASIILVGQYGHSNATPATELMDRLCDTYAATTYENVRRQIIHSIVSLSARANTPLTLDAQKLIQKATISRDWVIQQLAIQAQALLTQQQFSSQSALISSLDMSDSMYIDENLPFLDMYVQSALANGARPYLSPENRVFGEEEHFSGSATQKLKMDAYENPTKAAAAQASPISVPQTQTTAPAEPNLLNFDGMSNLDVQNMQNIAQPQAQPVSAMSTASSIPAAQEDPFQLKIKTKKWGAQQPPPPQPTQQPQPQLQQADFLFGETAVQQQQAMENNSVAQQQVYEQKQEEELDDKDLLAQSLFGGTTGGFSNSRRPKTSPRPSSHGSKKPASSAPDLLAFDAPNPSNQSAHQSASDLLDFSFDSGLGQQQQQQQQFQQQQGQVNLLGGLDLSVPGGAGGDPFMNMQQMQQPVQVQQQSGGMFMGMTNSTSNGMKSTGATPKKGPSQKSSDPFGDLLG